MQKRPLLCAVLMFTLGTLLGSGSLGWILSLIGMAVGVAGMLMLTRKRVNRISVFLVLFFLLGGLNGLRVCKPDEVREYFLNRQLYETIPCEVTGRVERTEEREDSFAFLMRADTLEVTGEEVPVGSEGHAFVKEVSEGNSSEVGSKVRELRMPGTRVKVWVDAAEQERIAVGKTLRVRGTLSVPEPATNPGGFDSEAYYRARGISYLVYGDEVEVLDDHVSLLPAALERARGEALSFLLASMDQREGGVLVAMLLGNTSYLDDEVKDLYQVCGISHVLAISALHISILGTLFYTLLRRAGVPLPVAATFTASVLVGYCWLTGFRGSAIRAVVMFLLCILGDLLSRTYDLLTALAVSCLLMLVGEPYRLFDSGFLLSFASVAALGGVVPVVEEILERRSDVRREKAKEEGKRIKKKKRFLVDGARSLRATLILQLVTAPLILATYHAYPMYGYGVNLLVVPLMAPLLYLSLGGLLAAWFWPGLGGLLLGIAGKILVCIRLLCQGVSALPGAYLVTGKIPVWSVLAYYGAFACVLYGLWRGKKVVRGCGALIGVFLCVALALPKPVKVVMLNVGQGDGLFVRTSHGGSILVDGGSSSEKKLAGYVLEPAIRYYGCDSVDAAFLSHMDGDHINGLEEILGDTSPLAPEVKRVVLPAFAADCKDFDGIRELAGRRGTEVVYMAAGDVFSFDGVRMECVYPLDTEIAHSENNTSLVLSMEVIDVDAYRVRSFGADLREDVYATDGGFSMLFTGDLEKEGEAEILALVDMNIGNADDSVGAGGTSLLSSCEVLKVGHHGSKSSSSEPWLETVSPEICLISCGRHNRYGHPADEVVERIMNTGADIYRTDLNGAIEITMPAVAFPRKNDHIERKD